MPSRERQWRALPWRCRARGLLLHQGRALDGRALDLVSSALGLGRSVACGGACRGISGACSGCIWFPPAGRAGGE